jgi:hypothetical protein
LTSFFPFLFLVIWQSPRPALGVGAACQKKQVPCPGTKILPIYFSPVEMRYSSDDVKWLRHNQSLSIAARADRLQRSQDSVKQILSFLGIQRNGYFRPRTKAQSLRKQEIFAAANAAGLGLFPVRPRVDAWIESGEGSIEKILAAAAVQPCNKWTPAFAASISPRQDVDREVKSVFNDSENRYAALRQFVAPNGKQVKVAPSPAQAARAKLYAR